MSDVHDKKTITPILTIQTYVFTGIIARPVGLAALLAILSVPTFKTAVILYAALVEQYIQLQHGANKSHFDQMTMTMMSALYQTNTFSWIFIELAHGKNNPRVNISPHSDNYQYSDSESTSLDSYSLIQCAYQRNNKYQLNGL